jgi:hypothetical protein
MTVVVTICSANYLAQAKTLGDSLLEHNPGYRFVIGLVDRVPQAIEPSYWHPHELLPVEELGIEGFAEMVQRYNLVELNTAVKPFYIEFLYRRDPTLDDVIYLDPDILVLGSFASIHDKLRHHNIVVTPHSCSYDDSDANVASERAMLATGIFNLGFIATSRSDDTLALLTWWQKRLRRYCYYQPANGLFVDQIWANLALVYFPKVHIEANVGYNMCYWNLFERSLARRDGRYIVNGQHDLIFYHFSSYSPLKPELVSSREPFVYLSQHPELKPLFKKYRDALVRNQYASMIGLECCFAAGLVAPAPQVQPARSLMGLAKGMGKRILAAFPAPAQKLFNRGAQFILRNTAEERSRELLR